MQKTNTLFILSTIPLIFFVIVGNSEAQEHNRLEIPGAVDGYKNESRKQQGNKQKLERIGPHSRWADFHCWRFKTGNIGFNMANFGVDGNYDGPGGEYPKGTDHFLINAQFFTVGVLKDPNGTTPSFRYAVSNGPFDTDWTPGRITNIGVPFGSLTFESPTAPDNVVYLIDTSRSGDWFTWPSEDGAPWDSVNGEPILFSQQDSWAVFNDADTSFHYPGGIPQPGESPIPGIGVNVQQSSYEFGAADNAVIWRWKIVNHTNVNYDSAFVILIFDPDLGIRDAGQELNDQLGTDSTRKMVYAYNQSVQPTPTGLQYAVGHKLLSFKAGNTPVERFSSYRNTTDDHIADALVFDTTIYFIGSGLDYDGTRRLASEGWVETDGSPFIFPGDPVTGSGLTSDLLFPNGEDHWAFQSFGPFQLQPGVVNDLIVAVIAGEHPDRLGAITDLRNEADYLQTLFDNQIAYLLGVSPTFAGPVAELGVSSTTALPGEEVYFYDWSLANPQDTTTIWKWDFDNDGTTDYESTNHWNRPKEWSYALPGVYSPRLIVTDAAGVDSVIKDSLITVYGAIATPFYDQFSASPDPDPLSWINTTTRVSDQSANPPSAPYALALDSNPDGPEMITSYPFDLSGQSDSFADMLVALRYWYEGKGNGSGPEPDDSLIVEFRNDLGAWIKAREYPGQSMSAFQADSVFLDSIDPGPGATFYHDLFQFRFRGTSTPPSTALHKDVWFVDDVYFGDIIVGIEAGQSNRIPTRFKLHQNYPNPFNPATTIKYDLPKDSKVTIKIYNVLGQEVRTLVDEPQTAGFRSVVWNGKNDAGNPVSSGVYVYRIEAEGFVRSKKMMLLR